LRFLDDALLTGSIIERQKETEYKIN
jgi:hypothetical protein